MATQVLVLDGVLASSGLTAATVANLNAQDTNWATATSNNVATSVRASTPTPSGPPNAGANLQTITVQTRKNSASGTGTPTATISVGVAGTKVLTSASFNVTSTTGQVNTFTFDFSAVTGAASDGSDLEMWCDVTQTGGSPSVRASGDVGYIAWTADYNNNVTLTPSLFSNSQSFFAPTVTTTYSLTSSLFTNSQTFFSPTVGTGAPQTLTPSLFTNTEFFFTNFLLVTTSNFLAPGLLSSSNTFFAPVLVVINSLTPSLLSNTQSFFSSAISETSSLLPILVSNSQTFFGVTVQASVDVILFPTLYDCNTDIFIPEHLTTWNASSLFKKGIPLL